MRFIIVGLGYFGSSLSIKLTEMGHEVIGVDHDMKKVSLHKNQITHTVCMDAKDIEALRTLPLADTDVVIVGIGEDFGGSVMAVANFKQLKVNKLISRSISPLHQTVLEAIGVDRIIRPEQEYADRLAKSLDMRGFIDSFDITEDYNIIEATVPPRLVGKTIEEVKFRKKYNINVLTIIRMQQTTNIFGKPHTKPVAVGVIAPDTILEPEDILVLFGNLNDIEKLLAY